jgi:hypothetical protein
MSTSILQSATASRSFGKPQRPRHDAPTLIGCCLLKNHPAGHLGQPMKRRVHQQRSEIMQGFAFCVKPFFWLARLPGAETNRPGQRGAIMPARPPAVNPGRVGGAAGP